MTEITMTEHQPQTTAVVRERVPVKDLPQFFGQALHRAMQAAQAQGRHLVGPPFSLYHGMPTNAVDVEAGFPVDRPISAAHGVTPSELPAGQVVEGMHVGPYDTPADLRRGRRLHERAGPFAVERHVGGLPQRPGARARPRDLADPGLLARRLNRPTTHPDSLQRRATPTIGPRRDRRGTSPAEYADNGTPARLLEARKRSSVLNLPA